MVLQARLSFPNHQALFHSKDLSNCAPRYFAPTNDTCTTNKTTQAHEFVPPGVLDWAESDMDIAAVRKENGESARTSQQTHRSTRTKRKKIELTLEWLDENYMVCEGVCLARCILYNHYLDFCHKNNIEPACAATFGKTIRRKFPDITTRRLGTRGHSKYHYYGIGIRESSIYYNSVFAGKGLTRFSPKTRNEESEAMKRGITSADDLVNNFGEDFPDLSLVCPENGSGLTRDGIQSISGFYRTFCQSLLRSAVSQPLEAVHALILRCWVDFPSQYLQFLSIPIVTDIICLYDSLLCDTLIEVLLPTPCDAMSEMQLLDVRNVGKQWEEWIRSSSAGIPEALVGKRVDVAQRFAQSIVRQTTFVNLSKTVRSVVANPQLISEMIRDFYKVDLRSIVAQSFYPNVGSEDQDTDFNSEHLCQLKDLINKQAGVDMFVEWLDTVVDQKVIKPSKQNGRSMKKRAHDFLLKWSFFEARIMHNLTINNANSINSFHYLRMMMDEYVWFAIETQFNNEKKQELRNMVSKNIKQTKVQPQVGAMQHGSTSRAMTSPNNDFSYPINLEGRPIWEEPFKYGGQGPTHGIPNLYDTPLKLTEICDSPYPQSNPQFYFETTEPFVLTDQQQEQLTYPQQYMDQTYTSPNRSAYVYHNGSTFAYLSNATPKTSPAAYPYHSVNNEEQFSTNATGYCKASSPNKRSYFAATSGEAMRGKNCQEITPVVPNKMICNPSNPNFAAIAYPSSPGRKTSNACAVTNDGDKQVASSTAAQSGQIVFDDLSPNLTQFHASKAPEQQLATTSYTYCSPEGTSRHASPKTFMPSNSQASCSNSAETLLTPNGYDTSQSSADFTSWSTNLTDQLGTKAVTAVLEIEANCSVQSAVDNLPAITSVLGP